MIFLIQWLQNRQKKKDESYFRRTYADPTSHLHKIFNDSVLAATHKVIMQWMDTRRIRHCAVCPNTDQMRQHETYGFICPLHWEQVEDLKKKTVPQAKLPEQVPAQVLV